MTLTEPEVAYLSTQRLGRLATVAPDGSLQNNPVGVHYNREFGSLDIYGLNMGATRKYRNVQANPNVAIVIDDIVSFDPWQVRGVEIRGKGEALSGQKPPMGHMSGEVIRVHPRRVISWNVDPEHPGMRAREVDAGGGSPPPRAAD